MKEKGLVKVLVVEDSSFMCKLLTNVLNSDPRIMVVGISRNGREALEKVPVLRPDIITMDIHMPVMGGFTAIKKIMTKYPTPIVVVSGSLFKKGVTEIFKAFSFGALDVIPKIKLEDGKKYWEEFNNKIKELSTVQVRRYSEEKAIRKQLEFISKHDQGISLENVVFEKGLANPVKVSQDETTKIKPFKKSLNWKSIKDKKGNIIKNGGGRFLDKYGTSNIVAIATSTGGPGTLFRILKKIPADFPCGIVIVQHIMCGFDVGLAEWLNAECSIEIKISEDSEVIKAGVAYIAPCNLQMRVEEDGKINLTKEGPRCGHYPSGDVLLESVALHYKDNAIGMVLTGMGSDGALGLKSIRDLGGRTFVQDEESSVIFGMPKRAIETGAVEKGNVLPPEKIAEKILDYLRGNQSL